MLTLKGRSPGRSSLQRALAGAVVELAEGWMPTARVV
jgi:hypothetical protein